MPICAIIPFACAVLGTNRSVHKIHYSYLHCQNHEPPLFGSLGIQGVCHCERSEAISADVHGGCLPRWGTGRRCTPRNDTCVSCQSILTTAQFSLRCLQYSGRMCGGVLAPNILPPARAVSPIGGGGFPVIFGWKRILLSRFSLHFKKLRESYGAPIVSTTTRPAKFSQHNNAEGSCPSSCRTARR